MLTSYLVSNAIILPMTNWLSNFFGRKRLLVLCVFLFTMSSVLCGAATSLSFLIVARVLQGIGGGAMLPIAQSVLLESFPPAKRGVAMAAYAMGVVVAPILGPTLGGWITDNYSWRWIFYINVPVGLFAMFMAAWVVEDPPYVKRNTKAAIDFIGFALLAVWLATLQVILDKGQQEDWFASTWITWFAVISVVSMLSFLVREFIVDHPIVNLRIFGNRNFAIGVSLMFLLAGVLYGTTAALPIFLQTLMGYSALESGYALSPRGCAAFVATFIVGRLVGKVRNRWLLLTGFILLATSSFWLANINMDIGMSSVILPSVLNGIAISFIFVPLTTTTMGHLRQEQMGNASGLFNLMRNLGGSVGIAFVTTILDRRGQVHQFLMVGHLTPYDAAFRERLAMITSALAPQTGSHAAVNQAYALIYDTLLQQSRLWAFVDNFRIFGAACLCCIPMVFLFKRVKRGTAPPPGAH